MRSVKDINNRITQRIPLIREYKLKPDQKGSLLNRLHKTKKAASIESATTKNARAWIQPCKVWSRSEVLGSVSP